MTTSDMMTRVKYLLSLAKKEFYEHECEIREFQIVVACIVWPAIIDLGLYC